MRESQRKSGYSDRFSNTLKVLREIKQELNDAKRRKNNDFDTSTMLKANPNRAVTQTSNRKISSRKQHQKQQIGNYSTNLRQYKPQKIYDIQRENYYKNINTSQNKLIVGNFRKPQMYKYQSKLGLQKEIEATAQLVGQLDQQYNYISNSTKKYKDDQQRMKYAKNR